MSTCTTRSSAPAAARPRQPSKHQCRGGEPPRLRNSPMLRGAAELAPRALGDGDESRSDESLQPAGSGAGLRPDPDLDREPGEDSVVVLRRDQEAGDDQLPDLQA